MSRIITVNNINMPELAVYSRLTEAQLKKDEGLFIAESVKVISVALNSGLEAISFLMEQRQIENDSIENVAAAAAISFWQLGKK